MNDPALAGDYDYYPTRYTGTSDNGGVHWNSGIANLAFYLMVTGGTHPRGKTSTVVPALDANAYTSIQMAAAIFYRANTVYLTPGSTFSDARGATAQAATDLYGAAAAAAVNEAWTAVGVAALPDLDGAHHREQPVRRQEQQHELQPRHALGRDGAAVRDDRRHG